MVPMVPTNQTRLLLPSTMQVFIYITKILVPAVMVLVLVPACFSSSIRMNGSPSHNRDDVQLSEDSCSKFSTQEIHTKLKESSIHFFDEGTKEASGVAIGRNLVLTNFHVWETLGLDANLLVAKSEDLDMAIIEIGLPWDQPFAEIYPGFLKDGETTWVGGWRDDVFLVNKGQSTKILRQLFTSEEQEWMYLSNHSTVPGNSGGGMFLCTWEGFRLTGITSFVLGQRIQFGVRPALIPTFIRSGQIPSFYVFELLQDKQEYLERLVNWQENTEHYNHLKNAQKLLPNKEKEDSSNPLK